MSVIFDEMILQGGLIVAAISMLSGIAYFAIYTVRKRKLNAKFDTEYGTVQKRIKNNESILFK